MENTINKIIAMDKDAEKFKQIKHNELKKKLDETNIEIDKMKNHLQDEIKSQRILIEKQTIEVANNQVKKINEDKEKEKKRILDKYNIEKNNIVNEIFNEIITASKEE